MADGDLISRASLLAGIEDLKESPWYNYGNYEGNFNDLTVQNMIDLIRYSTRKEAVEIIVDECIKKEPAQPVKQGNWENDKCDIPRCSCCSYIPEFNKHIDDYYYSDFCPNCGARMDLKEGDGE